jgi:uncharacterized protein YciI
MLFAVIGSSAGKSRAEVMAVYPRHKAFLDTFQAKGEVVGVGPFTDAGGGNMALFRSRAAAEAFAQSDPFLLEGLVKEYQIKEWGDRQIEQQEATKPTYFDVTEASGRAFFARGIEGPVVMINLLRFRARADYSATPHLAPPEPIDGAAAYQLYIDHTLPLLRRSGGDVVFLGRGGPFLIGPFDERWDAALLVRQRSVTDFMALASDKEYLAGTGHRTAALEDSRLLPVLEAESI